MRNSTRLVCALLALLQAWGGAAEAQVADSGQAAVASQPADPHHASMALGMLVVGASLLAAPPTLLYLPGHHDPALTFSADRPRVSAYASGGYSDAEAGANGWSWTEEVQAQQGRFFGGYRRINYELASPTRVEGVHIGYVLRALDWAEGGIALGYEAGNSDRFGDGIELALPVRIGAKGGEALLRPSYRFSDAGLRFGYRVQVEAYGLPDPVLIGFRIEADALRRRDDRIATYALLLGVRR